jgi:translation initiation factor IF-1
MKVQGTVTEALPGALFRVKLQDDKEILAYLAGKMRMHHIKLIPGDQVLMEMSQLTDTRARVVRRL